MKTNNPTKILKILKGSYKVANENGILAEFKFYYQVKSLTIHGFFKKGELQRFSDNLRVTPNHINKLLSKSVKTGFIRKENGGYQLISYDSLWSMLGYDLSDRNKFRIIRVLSINSFFDEYQLKEIGLNLKAQEAKIIEKQIKLLPIRFDAENVPKKLQKRLLRQLSQKSELRNNLLQIRKDFNDDLINYDITLSCQGISSLFGYNSKAQGFKLRNRLRDKGLLKVVTQPPVYISNQIPRKQLEFMLDDKPNCKVLNRIFINKDGISLMRRSDLIEIDKNGLESLYLQFNPKVNLHSTPKGGACGTSMPQVKEKEKKNKGINNTTINKNTIDIEYSSKDYIGIKNNNSFILGRVTVDTYLYPSKLNSSINIYNKDIETRKANQYYINSKTLRVGKIC